MRKRISREGCRELRKRYPEGTILHVVKPLYGLAESGAHWFETYSRHHRDKLQMDCSPFDSCLLITKSGTDFGITGIQTDDTLTIGTDGFIAKEDVELQKAGYKAKPQIVMHNGDTDDFNGCRIVVGKDKIRMVQKGQADKIKLVDEHSHERSQRYVEQRARGAYIASICQPETAFDLSVAAQTTEPTYEDIKRLNKRLQWQLDNRDRGLNFEAIDLANARLFVFVDGSFANNKDLSSQIGYVLVHGNEEDCGDGSFTLHGNTIHWSSTKCKRVTRSVLASEIYGMVSGFDLGFVINHTLSMIADRLGIPKPRLVLCTDSYSLYQCLVQLGTTSEKRLMIDVMGLRQSYESREIDEIRWICGKDNPADAMTKVSPNHALENLISHNRTTIRVEGWVERKE